MSVVSAELARAILANDRRAVTRAVRASDPPCTHVAQGVPGVAYAAFMQRTEALDALLCECLDCVDVNALYEHAPFVGWRAFHFANADRDAELAAKLAAAGCDTSPAPNDLLGLTWLDVVEGLSNNDFVGYLNACKAAADPVAFLQWTDPAGRGVLHVAAIIGSGPLVQLLFDLGLTNASPTDIAGNTPLSFAVEHMLPSLSCIQALIDRGAKPTAEHVVNAASRGLARLVALLVGSGAPVPPGVSRRAMKAAVGLVSKIHVPLAEASMLKSDVLMNEAIARDNIAAFRVLLATGAHDAASLLARTAACASVRILEVLLAHPGVDPNARINAPGCVFHGGTALHCAVSSFEAREAHVKALIAAGADVNAQLPCGFRPIDVATHSQMRTLWRTARNTRRTRARRRGARSAPRSASLWPCSITTLRRCGSLSQPERTRAPPTFLETARCTKPCTKKARPTLCGY